MKPLFTLFLFIVCPLVVGAQIYVKHDATGNLDGTSWQDAYPDLQNAIEDAGPGDQIWVAAGTYIPVGFTPEETHFIAEHPVTIYGGFNGTETSLSQRNWELNKTIISGDVDQDDVAGDFTVNRTDNAYHVFILNSGPGESYFDGLYFKGGMTRTDAFAEQPVDTLYHRWRGGAFYARRSNANIRNCIFTDNYGFQGTGLYATARFAAINTMNIENTRFEANGGYGGACYLTDLIAIDIKSTQFRNNQCTFAGAGLNVGNSNILIDDCIFESNVSQSQGGGFFIFQNSFSSIPNPAIILNNTVFSENQAPYYGGAIRINNFVQGFNLTIDSCTFFHNSAYDDGWGGAIDIEDYHDAGSDIAEDIHITNTTFSENSAFFGGAVIVVAADDKMNLDFSNCQFLNNTCPDGGGNLYVYVIGTGEMNMLLYQDLFEGNTGNFVGAMAMESSDNGSPMHYLIDDCTFSNNSATNVGGAIRSTAFGASPLGRIQNSRFINNSVDGWGGAIYTSSETLEIDRCLFENNSGGGVDPNYGIRGGGAVYSLGFPGYEAITTITSSVFRNNTTEIEGNDLYLDNRIVATIENSLFEGNSAGSSIANSGNLTLLNNTSVGNAGLLLLGDTSSAVFQNNIFNNLDGNLNITGVPVITSLGGNISADDSMIGLLNGFGSFDDLHNTDPLLGADFVPLTGSPAINAGNPSGVKNATDLAGNPRIMGGAIDAGSFEALSTSTHHAIGDNIRLQISPNPVADILTIAFDGKIEAMQVMTMDGKMMHAVPSVLESKQINISDLIPGQYILQIQSASKWYCAQFSKM